MDRERDCCLPREWANGGYPACIHWEAAVCIGGRRLPCTGWRHGGVFIGNGGIPLSCGGADEMRYWWWGRNARWHWPRAGVDTNIMLIMFIAYGVPSILLGIPGPLPLGGTECGRTVRGYGLILLYNE